MSGALPLAAASKLGDLLARLPVGEPNQWSEIELTAQNLANDLRSKNVDQQSALGKTLLPQTLTSLLKGARNELKPADSPYKAAENELLRVAANLCVDHDDNREALLDAGFPQTVVALLDGYADSAAPESSEPLPMSIPDLRIVKTSIGFLLNVSMGFDPAKTILIDHGAATTILKLSTTVYPAGSWQYARPADAIPAEFLESWTLRATISDWAWRVIEELRGDEEDPPSPLPIFGPDALPVLVNQLRAFIPPYPTPHDAFSTPSARHLLVQADFDVYGQVCGLIESLCIDVEDVRLSLARGLTFPEGEHGGVPCLLNLLTFIDKGDYPPYWSLESSGERAAKEKAFDLGKAAIVKAVVEVSGEEKNTDPLWDDSEPDKPGGEFVSRMVDFIKTHKDRKESSRDDLIICATLSLGNICRRDAHSTAIVKPPVALSNVLAALLEPETDMKVKHGVVGLLKHLALSQGNRAALGEAKVIERLSTSGVWGEKADLVELTQVQAIGVAKHMCNRNLENTLSLLLPSADSSAPTALDQILALVGRSDSIAVKSEGTRVLVNAVKSLFQSDLLPIDSGMQLKRSLAIKVVCTEPAVAALAQLIGRSRRYPALISEGAAALLLISTHGQAGTLVLDAILNPLPAENIRANQSQPLSAATVSEGSPVVGPRRAMDTLVGLLRSSGPGVPPEYRVNVCTLLGHLGRKGVVAESRAVDLERMKGSLRDVLEPLARSADGHGGPQVATAAKQVLDAWA